MKKHLASLALALSGLPFAAAAAGPAGDHVATKGGVFVEGKEADYELVAKPGSVQLWVFDHGKLRNVSKASAKVTLLTGSDKQEVVLQPAGDKLEATGSFKVGAGTKAIAVVTDAGKTLGTARFTLK